MTSKKYCCGDENERNISSCSSSILNNERQNREIISPRIVYPSFSIRTPILIPTTSHCNRSFSTPSRSSNLRNKFVLPYESHIFELDKIQRKRREKAGFLQTIKHDHIVSDMNLCPMPFQPDEISTTVEPQEKNFRDDDIRIFKNLLDNQKMHPPSPTLNIRLKPKPLKTSKIEEQIPVVILPKIITPKQREILSPGNELVTMLSTPNSDQFVLSFPNSSTKNHSRLDFFSRSDNGEEKDETNSAQDQDSAEYFFNQSIPNNFSISASTCNQMNENLPCCQRFSNISQPTRCKTTMLQPKIQTRNSANSSHFIQVTRDTVINCSFPKLTMPKSKSAESFLQKKGSNKIAHKKATFFENLFIPLSNHSSYTNSSRLELAPRPSLIQTCLRNKGNKILRKSARRGIVKISSTGDVCDQERQHQNISLSKNHQELSLNEVRKKDILIHLDCDQYNSQCSAHETSLRFQSNLSSPTLNVQCSTFPQSTEVRNELAHNKGISFQTQLDNAKDTAMRFGQKGSTILCRSAENHLSPPNFSDSQFFTPTIRNSTCY